MDKTEAYKILVSGCRWFNDYEFFSSVMDYHLNNFDKDVRLIFGEAKGTDTMAKRYAVKHELKWKQYTAAWEDFGKAAGPIRNQFMVSTVPDLCIFFWDGKTPGTGDCLKRAKEAGLKCIVVDILRR